MTTVAKEKRRIKRLIGALLATLAPLAVAEACGTDSAGSGGDGGADATLDHATDVIIAAEAAVDAGAVTDAPPGVDAHCTSTVTVHDAGYDADQDAYADPYCSYELSCGIMGVLRTSGCQVLSVNDVDAQPQPLGCWVVADGCNADVYVPDANVTVQCMDCIGGGGRRPAGLRALAVTRSSDLTGRYLAAMAFEERAAVLAFARMEQELARHRAPRSLRHAARRAVADERRHARVLGALARRHGAEVARARLRKTPRRSLLAIATENASEGCVRETFGAALLAYQATHASDATIQGALRKIAADEAAHAALSWALAAWAESRLGAAEVASVHAARHATLSALREEIARREPTTNDAAIGHPTCDVATTLLDRLAARLDLG